MAEEAPTVADLFYEPLGFHVEDDEEAGFALRDLCVCLGLPWQPVYDLVRERDDQKGWTVLLDPDECPVGWLFYSAQYVGAILTPGMTEAQKRLELREPTSWKRGQLPSIELITKREL